MKNNKKIKTITFFIIFILFSISVNALIYDDLNLIEHRAVNLIDYGKVSYPELNNKFNIVQEPAEYTIILDYEPFEQNTKTTSNLDDISGYYAYMESFTTQENNHIFILGKNEQALNFVISLTLNYQDHLALFANEFFIFDNNNAYWDDNYEYFSLNGNIGCDGTTTINPYTPITINTFIGEANLNSVSHCSDYCNKLYYPYCDNNILKIQTFDCFGTQGRCLTSDTSTASLVDFITTVQSTNDALCGIKGWITS